MTRNYRLFVAGQLVSLLGTWTRTVAQSWLVYRLAGSTVWLGIAAACQQVRNPDGYAPCMQQHGWTLNQ